MFLLYSEFKFIEEREKFDRMETRLKNSQEIIYKLRLTFMKELRSLRELLERKYKDRENFEYLEIRFFSPMDGLDEHTGKFYFTEKSNFYLVELFNEKLIDLKHKFEEYIRSTKERYEFLEKQVEAYNKIDPNLVSTTDPLSADFLVMKMSLVEKRPKEVWNMIEKHYGKDFLKKTAHFIYGLTEKDVKEIFIEQEKHLEEYKTKALNKMSQICDESELEIARLRSELNEKNQKYSQLETKYFKDIKE